MAAFPESKVMKVNYLAGVVASLCAPAALAALPVGAQVAAGSASFSQSGNQLTITNTPGAIINWRQFNIGSGEAVRFVQQSASSAVLNRVVGADPSQILGTLSSNGRVFLINPNGILFGQGAKIDVAGLVASSLNITDADFAAGRMRFSGSGASGAVANQGEIATATGGQVWLFAPNVSNSGIVTAPGGDVVLAAGHTVAVADAGSPDVRIAITAPADGKAVNLGQLVAKSGAIGIYGVNVVQGGTLDADAAVVGENGRIYLKATASLTATAGSVTRADGGDITLTSGELTAVETGASVRADDGRIRLWSDKDTFANGSFRARNGFIETSGQYVDVAGIGIDAIGGHWLIDPGDVIIAGTGTNCSAGGTCAVSGALTYIDAATIATALNAGTSVTVDTAAGSGGSGDIAVNAAITKSAGAGSATLTLNADRNLGVYANIGSSSGALDVVLSANRTVASVTSGVTISGNVSTNGGGFTASASNISSSFSTTVATAGGNLSLTANNTSGNNGLYLNGTLNSGGGHISLRSDSSSAGMQLMGTTNAGAGYVTLNLPNGGTATDNATSSHMITSGLEFLGNNANFYLGQFSSFANGGRSIYAPGATSGNTAQTGNPTLTIAGNLTGTSVISLAIGAPTPTYQASYGMNTDLVIGAVGSSTGLSARTVYLFMGNGGISQTQAITATYFSPYAYYSGVAGYTVNLTNAGNHVTTLGDGSSSYAGGAWCSYAACGIAAPSGPSFQFTNATALTVDGPVDGGNGAIVIKTLTGNLTLGTFAALRTAMAGTASSYANAITLVAGANTAANFADNSQYNNALNMTGAYARYLGYSKDAANVTLGQLARPSSTGASNVTTGSAFNGGYEAFFGSPYYNASFNGSNLPAAPLSAANPNILVFQTQPMLTVTANNQSMSAGGTVPTLTYGVTGWVLGDSATTSPFTGSLGLLGSVNTSLAGTYTNGISNQSLASSHGYGITYNAGTMTVTGVAPPPPPPPSSSSATTTTVTRPLPFDVNRAVDAVNRPDPSSGPPRDASGKPTGENKDVAAADRC
jgi:filamentous hemagglutinin family protein